MKSIEIGSPPPINLNISLSHRVYVKSKTKREILKSIPEDLLIEIHIRSRRKPNYKIRNLKGERLRDFLSDQYTKNELIEIARHYVINGRKAAEIAKRISKPSGDTITGDLIQYFPSSFVGIREVRIRRTPCDLCLINVDEKTIWAIEVKAEGDQIKRAIRQCFDYLLWADYVGVCITSKRNGFLKGLPRRVGIYEWDDGEIRCVRKPKLNKPDAFVLLDSIPLQNLKRIAHRYEIRASSVKKKTINDLLKNLDKNQISVSFIENLLENANIL